MYIKIKISYMEIETMKLGSVYNYLIGSESDSDLFPSLFGTNWFNVI